MNNVCLVGRLTRDPELKHTQSGNAVTSFTIAVDRGFTNDQGERDADFPVIVCWNKLAENVARYMKKGSQIAVSGSLRTRSYDDKDGKRVYVTEINARQVDFLDNKREQGSTEEELVEDDLKEVPF